MHTAKVAGPTSAPESSSGPATERAPLRRIGSALRPSRLRLGDPRWRLWTLAGALVLLAGAAGIALSLRSSHGSRPIVRPTAAFHDTAAGIQGSRPASWSVSHVATGVAIADPRRAALVEIAAPEPAGLASQLLSQSVAAIEHSYTGARLLTTASRRLDHLPAQVAVLSGRNRTGTPFRVLISVARGKREAYILEVFVTNGVEPQTVLDTQAIVNSLHLTG